MVGDGDTSVYFPSGSNVDFGTTSTFNFASKAAFSVEFWINPPAAAAHYPGIVSRFDTSGEGWAVQLNTGTNGVAFTRYSTMANDYADSDNHSPAIDLSPGTWYHVVGTYDGGTNIKIYVNGVLADTQSPVVSIPTMSTTHLYIAQAVSGYLDPYVGYVDELAIYSVALTQTQVTNHYNAGKP